MKYKILTSKLYRPLFLGLGLSAAGGFVLLVRPGVTLPLELGLISIIFTALQRLLIFIVPDPSLFDRSNFYRRFLNMLSWLGYFFLSIGVIWLGLGMCKYLWNI